VRLLSVILTRYDPDGKSAMFIAVVLEELRGAIIFMLPPVAVRMMVKLNITKNKCSLFSFVMGFCDGRG